jgi:hypothetical protein
MHTANPYVRKKSAIVRALREKKAWVIDGMVSQNTKEEKCMEPQARQKVNGRGNKKSRGAG